MAVPSAADPKFARAAPSAGGPWGAPALGAAAGGDSAPAPAPLSATGSPALARDERAALLREKRRAADEAASLALPSPRRQQAATTPLQAPRVAPGSAAPAPLAVARSPSLPREGLSRLSPRARRVAEAHAAALEGGMVPRMVEELKTLLEMLVLPPHDVHDEVASRPDSGAPAPVLASVEDAKLYASAVLEGAAALLPALGERLLEGLAESAHATPALAERAAEALAATRRASLRGGRAYDGGSAAVASASSSAAAADWSDDGAGPGDRAKRSSNRESARDAFCALLRQARAADAYAFGRASDAELRKGALALMGDLRADNVQWLAEEIVAMLRRAAAAGEADEEVVEIAGDDARLQQLHQRLTGPAGQGQSGRAGGGGGGRAARRAAAAAHAPSGGNTSGARRALIPGAGTSVRGGRGRKSGGGQVNAGGLSNSSVELTRLAKLLPESQAAYARLVEAADSHRLNTHLRAALLRAIAGLVDRRAIASMVPSAFTERTLELRALLALLAIVSYGPACRGSSGGDVSGVWRDPAKVGAMLDTAEQTGSLCFLVPAVVEFLRVAHAADASLFSNDAIGGELWGVPERLARMRRADFHEDGMAAAARLAVVASIEDFLEATRLGATAGKSAAAGAESAKPASAATAGVAGLDAMDGLIDARYVAVVCPSLDSLRHVLASVATASPGSGGTAAVATPRRRITPVAPSAARAAPRNRVANSPDDAKSVLQQAFMAKQPPSVRSVVDFVVDNAAVNAADAQLTAASEEAAMAARDCPALSATIESAAVRRRSGAVTSDVVAVQVDAAAVSLAEQMSVALRVTGAREVREAASAAAAAAVRSLAPAALAGAAREAAAGIAAEAAAAAAGERFLRSLSVALRVPLQQGAKAELSRAVKGEPKAQQRESEPEADAEERVRALSLADNGGDEATETSVVSAPPEGSPDTPACTAAAYPPLVAPVPHAPVPRRASRSLHEALSRPAAEVPGEQAWRLMVATAEDAALGAELRAAAVASRDCVVCASRLQEDLEALVDGLQAMAIERGEAISGGGGATLPAPHSAALEGISLQQCARAKALVKAAPGAQAAQIAAALDRVWASLTAP